MSDEDSKKCMDGSQGESSNEDDEIMVTMGESRAMPNTTESWNDLGIENLSDESNEGLNESLNESLSDNSTPHEVKNDASEDEGDGKGENESTVAVAVQLEEQDEVTDVSMLEKEQELLKEEISGMIGEAAPALEEPKMTVEEVLAEPSNDKMKEIYQDIHANESNRFMIHLWMSLMNEVYKLPIIQARPFYEEFLQRFPSAGQWWKRYAEHELREKNANLVQELLNKALMKLKCPSIDLWQFYLDFTRLTKADTLNKDTHHADEIAQARKLIRTAYELAIGRVGSSIYADGIWQSYIEYLKSEGTPESRMAVRKAYQRAISIPLNNMDRMWKEYEAFEKSLSNNDVLAQNLFKILRPKFDAARAILKDRKSFWDILNFNLLACPASVQQQDEQIASWERLLEFEMTNPERLDPTNFHNRVRLVFEQCLACQRYHPEIWFKYAIFESESGDGSKAIQVFSRAIDAMPDSTLIHFAYADFLELRNDITVAKEVYEGLLEKHPTPLVYILYQRFAKRAFGTKGLDEARLIFKLARKDKREDVCTHHVYTASALMEFHSDKTEAGKTIALNIFELGLKKFIKEPEYVLSYLRFLINLNDDNNTRSLFEKALHVLSTENSKSVWKLFLDFERRVVANGGSLKALSQLENRVAKIFPDDPEFAPHSILKIIDRYRFNELLPSSAEDRRVYDNRGSVKPRREQSKKVNKKTEERGDKTTTKSTPVEVPKLGADLPEFLRSFAALLPLGETWKGGPADVDTLYQNIVSAQFPSLEEIVKMKVAEASAGDGDAPHLSKDDREGTSVISNRPAHDIFRARQQQMMSR